MLKLKSKNSGTSIFELLVSLLILFFIVSGLALGFRDYLRRQKSLELHTTARQIIEAEKGRLLNLPISHFSSLQREFLDGICYFNGTCNFDPDCFNNMTFDHTSCPSPLRCMACLKGKRIFYDGENCTDATYNFRLSYTLADLYTPNPDNSTQILTETPAGLGICMKVKFEDPITNRTQSYKALVLKFE